jgi:basic amino acid/polyamine antiporter, APA family
MVKTTYVLGEAKNAQINLLHMVPVPEKVPLSDAEKFMMEGKEAIVEAMLSLILKFSITTTIRYCRNIARGILSAVKEKKIHLLIMGWHGPSRSSVFRLGSTIDYIMERAHCNVLILKGCGYKAYQRILVPVAGGPNGAFAIETASILAERDKGSVTAFMVNADKNSSIRDLPELNKNYRQINFKRIQTKHVDAPDVSQAILDETKEYDLVVIGATRDPLLRQVTKESISHTVAKKCRKPLIIAKAPTRIQSWISRWI